MATFTYDPLNRRTRATYADATVSYAYDAVGRLTEAVDSVGGTITNTYDVLDRLTSQAQPYGTVSYTYDGAGRRATLSVPGQAQISYGYDTANRLTSITQGANLVQFAHDAAGRRTALIWPSGQRTEYGYDTASRLATLTYKLGTSILGDLQYAYDAAGQRIAVGGSWARTGLPEPLASASYDASNEQVAFGPQSLTYDLNGNLTGDGTNAYVWDARNRLIGITGPTPASFVYDSLGRRRDKTLTATATGFLYDGVNPVKELTALGTADILTGPGIDEYLTRTGATGTVNFMTDALGSTIALADGAGSILGEYTYEPFGTEAGPAVDNAFQYTGRENDGTGLYYYRARYYHPQLQRFISEDPIGLAAGDVNFYVYVANKPLGFVDPLGLEVQGTIGVSGMVGYSPFMIGSPFGGAGLNVLVTSSGQIGFQFMLTGAVGVGFYGGASGQVGLGHTKCPTEVGWSSTTVGQADFNFGVGPKAVGASVQIDPESGAAANRSLRVGVGGGAMASAGVSKIWTFASPPLFGSKPKCGCP
jgi:RHS repeat-associated protein